MDKKCLLCNTLCEVKFNALIRNTYDASYLFCPNCHLLFIDTPTWLAEAYSKPINDEDTGILVRNLSLQHDLKQFLPLLFDIEAKYLDFAGGYGFLTRLMRDNGFDFYWHDKYTQNITAQGFEGRLDKTYNAITCFEAFEHFTDPLHEIQQMLLHSDTLIFSTEVLPTPIPKPEEWWYYGLSHGQHITFYSNNTFEYIANVFDLYYYSYNSLHIFSKYKPSKIKFYLLKKGYLKKTFPSKTFDDMLYIINKDKDKLK